MNNPYRFMFYTLVGAIIGQFVYKCLNPPIRIRERVINKIDHSTTIIAPKEIKYLSDNPNYPTKLIGFISNDTVYINFIPDNYEDRSNDIHPTTYKEE